MSAVKGKSWADVAEIWKQEAKNLQRWPGWPKRLPELACGCDRSTALQVGHRYDRSREANDVAHWNGGLLARCESSGLPKRELKATEFSTRDVDQSGNL